jgi:hypothetical protein
MYTDEPTAGQINARLQEALSRLQKEITRVEIWAAALSGFVQPVPGYEPSNDNLIPPLHEREEEQV